MTPALAVVPPMSKAMAFFTPRSPKRPLRTKASARRSRFQHVYTVPLGLLRLVETARRLHDQERAGKALAANMVIDLADVSPNDRPDIRVGRYRRAALELAIFLGEFMRGGDE